ncbi:hypothetical protein ElyMa_006493400 [Elysia marginata]|uniref:Uncharacterized protein n=1 Tax=Elysia marginata TaxID=1093978 RepID=A0AAV4I1H3_9GAST|nr:hypothetical protein ElyMa_006493400 [Elysia marginata]
MQKALYKNLLKASETLNHSTYASANDGERETSHAAISPSTIVLKANKLPIDVMDARTSHVDQDKLGGSTNWPQGQQNNYYCELFSIPAVIMMEI